MKRILGLVVLALVLTGCLQATLTSPTTPLTYGWVMAHHNQDWGVQVGPKTDASGTHVAVYAWQSCHPTCAWEFFQRYDTLTPGSTHDYAVIWTSTGWALTFDGRTLVTLNPGGPADAIYETNVAEHTVQ